jgi:N-terminal C2 in EEIG1 and EHBP1 proteins
MRKAVFGAAKLTTKAAHRGSKIRVKVRFAIHVADVDNIGKLKHSKDPLFIEFKYGSQASKAGKTRDARAEVYTENPSERQDDVDSLKKGKKRKEKNSKSLSKYRVAFSEDVECAASLYHDAAHNIFHKRDIVFTLRSRSSKRESTVASGKLNLADFAENGRTADAVVVPLCAKESRHHRRHGATSWSGERDEAFLSLRVHTEWLKYDGKRVSRPPSSSSSSLGGGGEQPAEGGLVNIDGQEYMLQSVDDVSVISGDEVTLHTFVTDSSHDADELDDGGIAPDPLVDADAHIELEKEEEEEKPREPEPVTRRLSTPSIVVSETPKRDDEQPKKDAEKREDETSPTKKEHSLLGKLKHKIEKDKMMKEEKAALVSELKEARREAKESAERLREATSRAAAVDQERQGAAAALRAKLKESAAALEEAAAAHRMLEEEKAQAADDLAALRAENAQLKKEAGDMALMHSTLAADNRALSTNVSELETRMASLQDEARELSMSASSATAVSDGIVADNRDMQAQIAQLEAVTRQLEAKLSDAEKRRDQAEQKWRQLSEQSAALDRSGDSTPLEELESRTAAQSVANEMLSSELEQARAKVALLEQKVEAAANKEGGDGQDLLAAERERAIRDEFTQLLDAKDEEIAQLRAAKEAAVQDVAAAASLQLRASEADLNGDVGESERRQLADRLMLQKSHDRLQEQLAERKALSKQLAKSAEQLRVVTEHRDEQMNRAAHYRSEADEYRERLAALIEKQHSLSAAPPSPNSATASIDDADDGKNAKRVKELDERIERSTVIIKALVGIILVLALWLLLF